MAEKLNALPQDGTNDEDEMDEEEETSQWEEAGGEAEEVAAGGADVSSGLSAARDGGSGFIDLEALTVSFSSHKELSSPALELRSRLSAEWAGGSQSPEKDFSSPSPPTAAPRPRSDATSTERSSPERDFSSTSPPTAPTAVHAAPRPRSDSTPPPPPPPASPAAASRPSYPQPWNPFDVILPEGHRSEGGSPARDTGEEKRGRGGEEEKIRGAGDMERGRDVLPFYETVSSSFCHLDKDEEVVEQCELGAGAGAGGAGGAREDWTCFIEPATIDVRVEPDISTRSVLWPLRLPIQPPTMEVYISSSSPSSSSSSPSSSPSSCPSPTLRLFHSSKSPVIPEAPEGKQSDSSVSDEEEGKEQGGQGGEGGEGEGGGGRVGGFQTAPGEKGGHDGNSYQRSTPRDNSP
eukprot:669554-Hanusia_phi.AAC.1